MVYQKEKNRLIALQLKPRKGKDIKWILIENIYSLFIKSSASGVASSKILGVETIQKFLEKGSIFFLNSRKGVYIVYMRDDPKASE